MIKAESKGHGTQVSITGSDMTDIMSEFDAIVSALIQLVVSEDVPIEIAMLGVHTSVLTGITKAVSVLGGEEDDDEIDFMEDIREAMKREHEGE